MKGMQSIKRGSGFNGLLKYALSHEKAQEDGRVIGGTMNGYGVTELTQEFAKVRALRRDVEKPVWHNSLRLPAGDECSDMKWDDIAQDYMTLMGFDVRKTQYVLVKHDDENAIHIIANRIQTDGKLYLGRNENLASTRHIAALEKTHGLTITKGLEYDENNKIKPGQSVNAGRKTAKELQKEKRTDYVVPKDVVKAAIKHALDQGACSAPVFAQRVKAAGVTVKANVATTTHKMNGFSFEVLDDSNTKGNTVVFKGSQVGASWAALQKAGVTYDGMIDYRNIVGITDNKADSISIGKATESKQEQWDKQAEALDADAYILHYDRADDSRDPVPPSARALTATEVRSAIPQLETLEDQGYAIAVEPVSEQWSYLRVHDTKPSKLERLRADGYTPNLAIRISKASGEVVLRVPKVKDQAHSDAERKTTNELTSAYGTGEPVSKKIPLAGFKLDGFVASIIDHSKAVCSKAKQLFDTMKASINRWRIDEDDPLDKLGLDLSAEDKTALKRTAPRIDEDDPLDKLGLVSPAPVKPAQSHAGPSISEDDVPPINTPVQGNAGPSKHDVPPINNPVQGNTGRGAALKASLMPQPTKPRELSSDDDISI